MDIKKIQFWLIQKLGGSPPKTAEAKHRFSVETRHGKYYADKIECHPGGAVEWWSKDPAWDNLHRIITESGVEITDESPGEESSDEMCSL